MSSDTSDEPVIINPTIRFACAKLTSLFSSEDELTTFIRAVSPQILSSVEVGQAFAFSTDRSRLFMLKKDEVNNHYITRYPTPLNSRRVYLYQEEQSRFDKFRQDTAERLKELNPFADSDQFFK